MKRIALVASMVVIATGGAFAGASAAANGTQEPTAGRIPSEGFGVDGTLDLSAVPDLVVVEDDDGREVGFISKEYLVSGWSPDGNEPQPVVERDGVTVVGHIYPGIGFVKLGENPQPRATAVTVVETEPGD